RLSVRNTNRSTIEILSLGNDTLRLNLYPGNNYEPDFSEYRAQFFLDRAIYRPGQRLFAKALIMQTDREGIPSLMRNEEYTMKLYDANGEEVASATQRTDQYGAISAEFTIPTGRLLGYWRVQIDGLGSDGFRVEEYKRPRFEVNIPSLEEPAVLDDSVTIEGSALAYSGPALTDARVSYRVERQVSWWSYRYFGGPGTTQAILAQGETTTDNEGRFKIDFVAESADESYDRYRPYYSFRLYVDVADQTGETHAAQAIVPTQQPYAQLRIAIAEDLDVSDEGKLQLILPPANSDSWNLTIQVEPVAHPEPATQSRRWPAPDRPLMSRDEFKALFPDMAFASVPGIEEWTSAGGSIFRSRLQISEDSSLTLPIENWNAGHYRVEVSYLDIDGEQQRLYRHVALSKLATSELPEGVFAKVQKPNVPLTVGEMGQIKLVHQPRNVHGVWSLVSRTRNLELNDRMLSNGTSFSYAVTEGDRGGLLFYLQYVYRNRHYSYEYRFNVPWKDKELQIEYETFRDRLRPGEPETWTLRVKDHEGEPVEAQVLASMYDASLDAITNHGWYLLNLFPDFYERMPRDPNTFSSRTGSDYYINNGQRTREVYTLPRFNFGPLNWSYRSRGGYGEGRILSYSLEAVEADEVRVAGAPPPSAAPVNFSADAAAPGGTEEDILGLLNAGSGNTSSMDDSSESPEQGAPPVALRTNLDETAFYQPELLTDQAGRVSIRFTSPEALTSWKFQVLAHTGELAHAISSRELKTQKELMILPNAPRFLREGDRIQFTAKVSNLSEEALAGLAELELFDLETEERLASDYQLSADPVAFNIDPQGSQVVQWEISVPAGAADKGEIGFRVIARSGEYSDGEQDRMPILTNRIFLTSTESFYLRANERKAVTLEALANAQSASLTHMGYSLEVTSNPAWLAVKSLPYLVEYPYNCSEQLVNRYFANQISHHLVRNKPSWRTVFEQWQGDSTALLSELDRNQDLKEALLEETPWLREAEDEREQRRRLGLLFDLEAVAARQQATWQELAARQMQDGGFSWMPGGRVSPYITAYVLESLARLQALGVLDQDEQARMDRVVERGLNYLDNQRFDAFHRWLRGRELTDSLAETYSLQSLEIHYYYLRSYFSTDEVRASTNDELGVDLRKFQIPQSLNDYWALLGDRLDDSWPDRNLYEQAMAATAFVWDGQASRAEEIMISLRERALRKDELGMHWPYGRGYRWYELPIETHTRLMEAFLVNGATQEELNEMRLWLLQNKRTNRWSSTKSTAAAVYALLQGGSDWLGAPNAVGVNLPHADRSVWSTELAYAQNRAESGTGYYRMSLPAESVSTELATAELSNSGSSVAWGAMYWQFTEDIDQVQADADGPLALQRKLFRQVNTDRGERLEPIQEVSQLRTGDRLRIQLVVTVDRELDFVHLKDRRAAGLEPVEQLSGYRYSSGLGFYFNPTDLAVNFFFDELPRGTHTLEYDLFVTQEGDFSNGLSHIQCMYAPEF
ncbi:MAG: alpha-2-macroglobulin family protein, partial [Bacteroidota bacterium]